MPKEEKKKSVLSKKWKKYEISTDGVERKKTCPKCGPGVFMAQHQDRDTCGSCGYTEFRKSENRGD